MSPINLRRFLRVALMLFTLTCVHTSAPMLVQAQTTADKQKAADHFGRGKELYEEGDYQGALVEFERAYELAPNYRVLYNIGQVKYQLQDYPGAMSALEQYLREGGAEIAADRRTQVLSDVERLRSRVAYLRIEVNEAGATVSVDDRQVGVSPLPKAVAVSAGRRKISASADGAAPVVKFVDLAGGDSSDVSLEILRTTSPTPTPTPTPPPGGGDNTGGTVPWAAWGITGGFGVGALVFGLLALDAANDFEDVKAGETTKAELEADRKRVLGFAIATDVFLGAAVITAAISIYLTVDGASSSGEPSSEVGVRVTPTGIALEGTF